MLSASPNVLLKSFHGGEIISVFVALLLLLLEILLTSLLTLCGIVPNIETITTTFAEA